MQAGWAQTSATASLEAQREKLSRAFASFTKAAGSLEHSYSQLQGEVAWLRRELQERNRDLAHSLEQNRNMREYLGHILEGLPCGVIAVDEDGRIRLANAEAHRLLSLMSGVPQFSEPVSELPLSLLPLAAANHGDQEFMAAGESDCWVAVRHARVAEGKDTHTVFVLEDISEHKRLERERERIRRQEALAEMSAVLAHEIRNPLGSLELFAGLLADDQASREERAQWIVQMQAGLRSLSATVNNVLHFHSLPPAVFVACDLGEILERAFEFVRPLGSQCGVEMAISNGLHGVTRPADPQRVQQVLLNLALNALRFTPRGGRVRFAGHNCREREGSIAEMQVADTGRGIAPEQVERIFEAGFTTRPGSPGLGLAVCKKIMEQHGGEIQVASQPGQGAQFRLRFPLP